MPEPVVTDANTLRRCVWCSKSVEATATRIELPGAASFFVCDADEKDAATIAQHLLKMGAAKGAAQTGLRLPQTVQEWETVAQTVKTGLRVVKNAVTAYSMMKAGRVPVEEILKAALREALK